jgi:hypothetical protein
MTGAATPGRFIDAKGRTAARLLAAVTAFATR